MRPQYTIRLGSEGIPSRPFRVISTLVTSLMADPYGVGSRTVSREHFHKLKKREFHV
jgi:hypothetical protein